jgi:hypothetical protein
MVRAGQLTDGRFGSKADVRTAIGHVRFTPNNDRKSRHAANGHVRFAPGSGHVRCNEQCPLWARSGHSSRAIGWALRP